MWVFNLAGLISWQPIILVKRLSIRNREVKYTVEIKIWKAWIIGRINWKH